MPARSGAQLQLTSEYLSSALSSLVFWHFFYAATEPDTQVSLIDPPGGCCPVPSPSKAIAWSYAMAWATCQLLGAVPCLHFHSPSCRLATACAVCVPVGLEFGPPASAAICIAVAWAPVNMLLCGKRGVAEAREHPETKRRPGGRPPTPAPRRRRRPAVARAPP